MELQKEKEKETSGSGAQKKNSRSRHLLIGFRWRSYGSTYIVTLFRTHDISGC